MFLVNASLPEHFCKFVVENGELSDTLWWVGIGIFVGLIMVGLASIDSRDSF